MKTTNNNISSLLRVAAAVATLRGTAVLAVITGNECADSWDLVKCPKEGYTDQFFGDVDTCQDCTHVSTHSKPLWHNRGVWVDRCYDMESVDYRQWNQGSDCSWDGHRCANSDGDECFALASNLAKPVVTKTKSIKWSLTVHPNEFNVRGNFIARYSEERSGPGIFGNLLRAARAARGLSVMGEAICWNCPVPCVFQPTMALWAISPDPHKDSHYGKRGEGAEAFYDYVGPRVAGAGEIDVKFDTLNDRYVDCTAAEIPVFEWQVKWRGTVYTFTPLTILGQSHGTCSSMNSDLCGAFGTLRSWDNTRCSGAEYCKKTCCDCPVDSYHYADSCPHWADAGYCDHSYVDWMAQYCGGSCCRIS